MTCLLYQNVKPLEVGIQKIKRLLSLNVTTLLKD